METSASASFRNLSKRVLFPMPVAFWFNFVLQSNGELGALYFTIAATVTAKFLADIVSKAFQLFNGLQIQSPIVVTPVVQPVSPVTDASTKTIPIENN